MTLRVADAPTSQTGRERLAALGLHDTIDILAVAIEGALIGACSLDDARELFRDHARTPNKSAEAFAALRALNEFAALGKVPTVDEARERIRALVQP